MDRPDPSARFVQFLPRESYSTLRLIQTGFFLGQIGLILAHQTKGAFLQKNTGRTAWRDLQRSTVWTRALGTLPISKYFTLIKFLPGTLSLTNNKIYRPNMNTIVYHFHGDSAPRLDRYPAQMTKNRCIRQIYVLSSLPEFIHQKLRSFAHTQVQNFSQPTPENT